MAVKVSSRETVSTPSISELAASYRLSLTAEGKSPKTITVYMSSLEILAAFLTDRGHSLAVESITKKDMREFMGDQLERHMPATASNRFRSLKTFFRWAVAEEEISSSPMEGLKSPHIPATPPAVLDDAAVSKMLAQCSGRAYEDYRDAAIIRLFLSTGCRRAEIAGLKVEDVDLQARTAIVTGKGSLVRLVRFGSETALAMDRYIRKRKQHRSARLPQLWLGHEGPMTHSGIYQVVRDRAAAAGLGNIKPHQFRHTFAHNWLASEGNEGDLMRLTGWKSRQMVTRYGASAADARAYDAYDKHAR